MAQKVQVTLVDDIDGGEAAETVSFSLDGVSYEIDLSEGNATKLREGFALYVGSARRSGSRSSSTGAARAKRPARASSSASGGSGDVRAWARDNGHTVSDRGRIPSTVLEAYEKAHA